jgi:capsular exopolysaccharide synthesis family protein
MSHVHDLFRKVVGEKQDHLSPRSTEAIPENMAKAFDLHEIPIVEAHIRPASRIVCQTDPNSPAADRFRALRMRLRELRHAGKVKSLLITSPLPHDGKSTVSLNLATALSEQGKRAVLLIEGDLHHSHLIQHLGLDPWTGLTECLDGGINPLSAIRRVEPLGWHFLPAGAPRSNATELLQSATLAGVMQKLAPYFDWIVIDSPPVLPLTDALSLQRQTDAYLLVVRAEQTPREAVEEAVVLLGKKQLLGIILNGVEGLDQLYSKYGYHGTYGAK